jgi:hypothetical protein
MRARLLLPLLLAAAAPVPAAQNVRGTLIDAGGNGAQYAVFYLIGPQNRLQNGSCPGGRSLGEPPTGQTTCETTFNTGGATEWQSGDVIVARALARFQSSFPPSVKPPDVSSCIVTFQGWSGVCTGTGRVVFEPGTMFPKYSECEFTLPASGDVEIGAAFSGEDNLNRPCPAIPFAGGTTTTTVPGASTTTTTLPGTPVDPISAIVDQFTDVFFMDFRRGQEFYDWLRRNPTLRPVLPPLPPSVAGAIVAEITALNGAAAAGQGLEVGRTSGIAPGARGVVARGKAKLRRAGGPLRLRLEATKAGRKLLKARTVSDVQLTVTVRSRGGTATRTVPVLLDE